MTIIRPPALSASLLRLSLARRRLLSASPVSAEKNRIFTNARTPEELDTLTLLSAASNRPLITLWTASWCKTCANVKPVVRSLIEDEGVGEVHGGLGYTEVELDSVLIGDLGMRYMINSLPTLLAFSRQEPQVETKVTRPDDLKDKAFLRTWLEAEARRRGAGGAGGKWFGGGR